MDIRAILAFIAIAFISSLFNKNKTGAKPSDTTNRSAPGKPVSTGKTATTTQTRRKSLSSGLEDLFREMRTEFEKNFGGGQKGQAHSTIDNKTEKEKDVRTDQNIQKPHISNNTTIEDSKRIAGTVYEGEIGKEAVNIEFNKKSIVQAVIMSEILQKPKSLRR